MRLWRIVPIWLLYALTLNAAMFRRRSREVTPTAGSGHTSNGARLLIIGATGGTGRELVRQALQQGYQVTAFVRTPAKLKLQHPNLRTIKGDVLHYESVELAMRNQDVVVSALGHKRLFWP